MRLRDFSRSALCRLFHRARWDERETGWSCALCGLLWLKLEFAERLRRAHDTRPNVKRLPE
jgi:hypothetical protein